MGGFCSGNSARPFLNIGGMGFGKNIFSTAFAVLVWLSQFWNGIFISDDGFYIRGRNLHIFLFYDLDGNKRQKRRVVLILNYTPSNYLKSFNNSSSAFSSTLSNLSLTCFSSSFSIWYSSCCFYCISETYFCRLL